MKLLGRVLKIIQFFIIILIELIILAVVIVIDLRVIASLMPLAKHPHQLVEA